MLSITEHGVEDAAFAACLAIRIAVFVDEQHVPIEEETDALDAGARHFLARLDGEPAGTLRLINKTAGTAKITRVAVMKPARGGGLGAALMRAAEAASAAEMFLLDAQIQALRFYERLGYEPYGEAFMEAGILHRHMRKQRAALTAGALNGL